jgi:hypothetical protein
VTGDGVALINIAILVSKKLIVVDGHYATCNRLDRNTESCDHA